MSGKFNAFYDGLDLSPLRRLCLSQGKLRRYARGQLFATVGEPCPKIGLLKSGYFKYCVSQTGGAECVTGFAFKDEFVADFSRSLAIVPCECAIIAGRSSEVYEIDIETFRKECLDSQPHLETQIMHTLFRELYTRFLDSYRLAPKERYQKLEEAHPSLLQDVPLREIASYLMISPIHLSRLRRQMLQK